MECVFCSDIVIKPEVFYENENFMAVYNSRPVVKGHCLVIPKRHILETYQLNDSERKDFISFSNKAIFLALKYSNASDFDFLLQKGEKAGQSIRHLHFHIIPREENDVLGVSKTRFFKSFSEMESGAPVLEKEEMTSIVNEIKEIAEKSKAEMEKL